MVLQHSSMECPYFGTLAIILLNAKVGTFPLSYAVIPSFISCFTAFYCIGPYFIFKITIFKILQQIPCMGNPAFRVKIYSCKQVHMVKALLSVFRGGWSVAMVS